MKNSFLITEVVEPYAQALMSVAESNNFTEAFGEELRSLLELLNNSSELATFLANPILDSSDKKAVLRQIFREESNSYLINFFMLLVDRGRIIFLEEICQQYLELLRKQNGTALAIVTSATELSDAQRQAASEKVKQMTNAQSVELQTVIDPDLIGGVIIKVGSQVLDASLRGQLRRIGVRLNSAT